MHTKLRSEKTGGKRPLEMPRRVVEGNIIMDVREIG
jgi:hypothetical protein